MKIRLASIPVGYISVYNGQNLVLFYYISIYSRQITWSIQLGVENYNFVNNEKSIYISLWLSVFTERQYRVATFGKPYVTV